jgi:hypothetical protein
LMIGGAYLIMKSYSSLFYLMPSGFMESGSKATNKSNN